MAAKKIFTIDEENIKLILGSESPLCATFDEDPRQIYDFFRKRVDSRKSEADGNSTIEELFMIYLLSESLHEKKRCQVKTLNNGQQTASSMAGGLGNNNDRIVRIKT